MIKLNYRSLPALSGLTAGNPYLVTEDLLPGDERGGLSIPALAMPRSDTVETADTLLRYDYQNNSPQAALHLSCSVPALRNVKRILRLVPSLTIIHCKMMIKL